MVIFWYSNICWSHCWSKDWSLILGFMCLWHVQIRWRFSFTKMGLPDLLLKSIKSQAKKIRTTYLCILQTTPLTNIARNLFKTTKIR